MPTNGTEDENPLLFSRQIQEVATRKKPQMLFMRVLYKFLQILPKKDLKSMLFRRDAQPSN